MSQEKRRINEEGILYRINSLKRAGYSNEVIGKRLKRSPSTIGRWIRNNEVPKQKVSRTDRKTFNRFYSQNTEKITTQKRVEGVKRVVNTRISSVRKDMKTATEIEQDALKAELKALEEIKRTKIQDLIDEMEDLQDASGWAKWRTGYAKIEGMVIGA